MAIGVVQKILNSNLIAIQVINVIDSHHLGLLTESAACAYLKAIAEYVINTNPLPKNASALEADMDQIFHDWLVTWKSDDRRPAIDPKEYPSLGTVMAVGAFKRQYAAAYNTLVTPSTSKTSSKFTKIYSKSLSPEAQVDADVSLITLGASKNLTPLIPPASKTMWVAPPPNPPIKSTSTLATELRDRLGLDHLPYKGQGDPESTTLIKLVFKGEDISAQSTLKRPALFDNPGKRFRALTKSDCMSTCLHPLVHGNTMWLGSKAFKDGYPELTYFAGTGTSFARWDCIQLGRLSGLHAHANHHGRYAAHLKSIRPKNHAINSYRLNPDGLQIELLRLISKP
jgi:hypothetical protein